MADGLRIILFRNFFAKMVLTCYFLFETDINLDEWENVFSICLHYFIEMI